MLEEFHAVPVRGVARGNAGELLAPDSPSGGPQPVDLCLHARTLDVVGHGAAVPGDLVALDTKTGAVVWQRTMGAFSWSSPVLVKGSDGHVYGVQGDSNGVLHLFNPNTGEDYSTLQLEKNIEASPAVYGNMLVVGTYAKKLYGIRIS